MSLFKAPIGVDHFPHLVQEGYTFVDKTLFIAEVLQDSAMVSLITRPRRFGKTLNLSMLQSFLDCRTREEHQDLFRGLLIEQEKELVAQHFGRYPVLFVSLKGIKAKTFSQARDKIRADMNGLVMQHDYLLDSPYLSGVEKNLLQGYLDLSAAWETYPSLLLRLSWMLHKHWQQRVVILIDEYDAPIHSALHHDYYDDMIQWMREFLGAALKGNPHLHRAVLTGILRISTESLFSDLNNLEVHTPLGNHYGSRFGFVESEVDALLRNCHMESSRDDIRRWFNGYRMGQVEVYNPWSIMSCLKQGGEFKRYWANTGDTRLIEETLAQSNRATKMALETLLTGGEVAVTLNPHMVFAALMNRSVDIWYLMLSSGYLTAELTEVVRGQQACRLRVPNLEVMYVLQDLVNDWCNCSPCSGT